MKVSDPILFGYAVETYFSSFVTKHPARTETL